VPQTQFKDRDRFYEMLKRREGREFFHLRSTARRPCRSPRTPVLVNAIVTLPLVLAIVLVEIAVGGAFLGCFLDRRGLAPGGFLKLASVVDAVMRGRAAGSG
jgi:hypothetical protein